MGVRRTKHAVCALVWIPRYRKDVLSAEVSQPLKEVFQRIVEEYEFRIDIMEIMEDHMRIFVEAPPRYFPVHVVQVLKNISSREIFKKFPKSREQLWAGEFWNGGCFVRSAGDKVAAGIIRKYIEYQIREQNSLQLRMFEKP